MNCKLIITIQKSIVIFESGLFCCSLAGNWSLLAAEIVRLLLPAPTSFRVSVEADFVGVGAS